jgi:hypothetical protein
MRASAGFIPKVTFRFAIGGGAVMRCPVSQGRNMTRERFFGGSPGEVILKLAVTSVIIGVVLSFFGLNPDNLYYAIVKLGDWISSLGLDAVKKVFHYLLLGAIIVVPLWFLSRVFSLFSSGRAKKQD